MRPLFTIIFFLDFMYSGLKYKVITDISLGFPRYAVRILKKHRK